MAHFGRACGRLNNVSLGEITKQIAKQALGEQVKEVMGGTTAGGAAAPAEGGEGIALVMVGQMQAMQNALKPEQELLVHCWTGGDRIRVMEVFAPTPRVLVLTGLDGEQGLTRVIAAAESLQLVCKPVAAGAKPVRIRFVTARAKGE